jgi:hypothetical protein
VVQRSDNSGCSISFVPAGCPYEYPPTGPHVGRRNGGRDRRLAHLVMDVLSKERDLALGGEPFFLLSLVGPSLAVPCW